MSTAFGAGHRDFSPLPGEQQLPRRMHSEMEVRPTITVGVRDADIIGSDNRALQAAVDYIAGLGGGVVEIGAGEYIMHDSLHLRSHVTVRGTPGKTILRKAAGSVSPLGLDGDYGEEQVTVVNPDGFEVGYGVAVWDDNAGGFHTTVARITGKDGNTFSIDTPLNADCMVSNGAKAATVFPVVSGYHLEGARLENLIIEGNKEENVYLTGCRGAGIFLYRGFGTVIENCEVSNYHGDGISFQQSNDVTVRGCVSDGNTGLGIHPGSGSQRPVVRDCVARGNDQDGLFLCWRVRHGLFEGNVLENNGRFGISIGHKDTDNLLRKNEVRFNHRDGVFFRNETEGMAGHRNRLENNLIENNGVDGEAAGIRVRGETKDLVFKENIIRDTRAAGERKQTVGVRLEEKVGEVKLDGNRIEAEMPIEDQRKSSGGLPVRGLHLSAPSKEDLGMALEFIRNAMSSKGVNTLILEFDYQYDFQSRSEFSDPSAIGEKEVKQIVQACRENGIQLIPQINCLGHQSWGKQNGRLLREHPQFDETPGKYPENEGIYCRSYCPLHPEVHDVLFDLIDELVRVCEADAFHVGMDEVFILADEDCPRCAGKDPAKLFAGEVARLHEHLKEIGCRMWMWGDRLIDGEESGLGKWEASENGTAAAVEMIPKDIVICDWHYNGAPETPRYFVGKGFDVVASPWRKAEVALEQLEMIRGLRTESESGKHGDALGMVQTTWCGFGPFVKAYRKLEAGETAGEGAAGESADCFRTLFGRME